MEAIEIPIRELHARTGHYVRKAARDQRVVITERGRPVAELVPLTRGGHALPALTWADRLADATRASFRAKLAEQSDSKRWVSEDRDRA